MSDWSHIRGRELNETRHVEQHTVPGMWVSPGQWLSLLPLVHRDSMRQGLFFFLRQGF